MGELAEVLELLGRARRSWTSVRVSVRWWSNADRSRDAMRRQLRQGRPPDPLALQRSVDKPPLPAESEWFITVSVAPDRLDVEYEGKGGGIPIRKTAGAINGRAMSVTQPNPVQHLLDPSGLPALVDLTAIVARGHVAGRPVRFVSAKPSRPWQGDQLYGLAPGADRYLLAVDDERGVVMRLEAQVDDEAFTVTEVTGIAFDEGVPDELVPVR